MYHPTLMSSLVISAGATGNFCSPRKDAICSGSPCLMFYVAHTFHKIMANTAHTSRSSDAGCNYTASI